MMRGTFGTYDTWKLTPWGHVHLVSTLRDKRLYVGVYGPCEYLGRINVLMHGSLRAYRYQVVNEQVEHRAESFKEAINSLVSACKAKGLATTVQVLAWS